jgi:transposase
MTVFIDRLFLIKYKERPQMYFGFTYRLKPNKMQLAWLEHTASLHVVLFNKNLELTIQTIIDNFSVDGFETFEEAKESLYGQIKTFHKNKVWGYSKTQANYAYIQQIFKDNPELVYNKGSGIYSNSAQLTCAGVGQTLYGPFKAFNPWNIYQLLKGNKRLLKNFPRFKKQNDYKSFSNYGKSLVVNAGKVSFGVKQPSISFIEHRPFIGKAKKATFKKDTDGNWYVSIISDIGEQPKPVHTNKNTSIDFTFALSEATKDNADLVLECPGFYQKSLQKLVKLQKRLSRQTEAGKKADGTFVFSNRRQKTKARIAKLHFKIKKQREYYAHNLTKIMAEGNETVTVSIDSPYPSQPQKVKPLVRKGRTKKKTNINMSILNAGWHKIKTMLSYKTAFYGGTLVSLESTDVQSAYGQLCPSRESLSSLSTFLEEFGKNAISCNYILNTS